MRGAQMQKSFALMRIAHQSRPRGCYLPVVSPCFASRVVRKSTTSGDVAVLSCAGTGGLEAAIVNTLSPGDAVLVVAIGALGDRFAKIAAASRADISRLDVDWGHAVDPESLRGGSRRAAQRGGAGGRRVRSRDRAARSSRRAAHSPTRAGQAAPRERAGCRSRAGSPSPPTPSRHRSESGSAWP